MKVRESQIPEESGKPQFIKGSKPQTDIVDGADEEPKRLKKTMINFQEEGIVISAYDLTSIEKDMRFVETPKPHFEFGITINKGLTPSQFISKTDLSMWYMKEEVRDKKWKHLIDLLEIEGLKVIVIE